MELKHDSRIKAEFTGWSGDTVFELSNGTRWRQARYRYRYRYRYRPRARIWRDGGRYYLEVDGMAEKIQVRRL